MSLPVTFQFTCTKAPTRSMTYTATTLPTWNSLSSSLSSFYEIPIHALGLTYVDHEGDGITINTNEELQQYYAAADLSARAPNVGHHVRFGVVDLSNEGIRDSTSTLSDDGGVEVNQNGEPGPEPTPATPVNVEWESNDDLSSSDSEETETPHHGHHPGHHHGECHRGSHGPHGHGGSFGHGGPFYSFAGDAGCGSPGSFRHHHHHHHHPAGPPRPSPPSIPPSFMLGMAPVPPMGPIGRGPLGGHRHGPAAGDHPHAIPPPPTGLHFADPRNCCPHGHGHHAALPPPFPCMSAVHGFGVHFSTTTAEGVTSVASA